MQESIVRSSVRMLMPNGKKSLFDQAAKVKRSVRSKLASPGPKEVKTGRIKNFSGLNPMMMVKGFEAPRNFEFASA